MWCPQLWGQSDHGLPVEQKLKVPTIPSGQEDYMEKAETSLSSSSLKEKVSKLI